MTDGKAGRRTLAEATRRAAHGEEACGRQGREALWSEVKQLLDSQASKRAFRLLCHLVWLRRVSSTVCDGALVCN